MTLTQAGPARTGAWLEDPGFGVYVHIPFCRHRCHYCDFNTYEGQADLHRSYVDALIATIESAPRPSRPATSVFFGGGTPTLLEAGELARILDAVRLALGVEEDAEVTVEANPETVDERVFAALLEAGFNRFSVGVQSLVPHVLRGLGRTHGPDVAVGALRAARRAGVEDLNADLIYGSPWERGGDWLRTLEEVVELSPEHVSCYALTVEEETPLATLVATGRVPDVDPDVQAERHGVAESLLGAAGYRRYEVSNWARPHRASRHNVLYWSAGDYLGLGAGAHGHVAGRRCWNVRLPREFIGAARAGSPVEQGAEVLGPDQRAGEALMLGLRLSSGIDEPGFVRRFGAEGLAGRAAAISELGDRGLVVRDGDRLKIPAQTTLVANEALCTLL
ncbi:MAG: radical SAM family heme chaperone HemW [Actinomycetota bacterium]